MLRGDDIREDDSGTSERAPVLRLYSYCDRKTQLSGPFPYGARRADPVRVPEVCLACELQRLPVLVRRAMGSMVGTVAIVNGSGEAAVGGRDIVAAKGGSDSVVIA